MTGKQLQERGWGVGYRQLQVGSATPSTPPKTVPRAIAMACLWEDMPLSPGLDWAANVSQPYLLLLFASLPIPSYRDPIMQSDEMFPGNNLDHQKI